MARSLQYLIGALSLERSCAVCGVRCDTSFRFEGRDFCSTDHRDDWERFLAESAREAKLAEAEQGQLAYFSECIDKVLDN